MMPPLLLRLLVAAAVVFVTAPCCCSATAAIGLGGREERPKGNLTNCDDLPAGYCHRRTQRDKQFVEEWKENKRKKLLLAAAAAAAVRQEENNNNDNSLFHRRHLVDVQEAPSLPFAPGEYEPVEGILLAYDYWDMAVVAGIAAAVTRQETHTKVYMVVGTVYSYTADDKADAENYFIDAGVNMTRVVWIREPIDAVWIRDYGPRYICHNKTKVVVRGGVDTKYYTYRPYDDTLPTKLGNGNDIGLYTNYDLNDELIHSGGNGHYFSTRKAFATRLVVNDNVITEAQIKTYWNDYTGAELHLFPQLSFSVDGTGHIDMWFLPVNDTAVIIGQWAREDSFGSKKITDDAAQYMTNLGYTVYRTPNQVKIGVHYTYTNAVIANRVVILSKFGVAADATALVVFKTAFPGHTIVQVDSSSIIQRSGALHCIAQHVYDCAKSNPKTSKPISTPSPKPTSVKPTTRPTTTKPSAKPTTAPTAKKPTSSKPSTAKPLTSKPLTRKPTTVKPSARPSTAKPSTAKPVTTSPITKLPTSKPVTATSSSAKPTSAKPSTKLPTGKPTTTKPVTKSTIKPTATAVTLTNSPTRKPTTSKPTTRAPTNSPTTGAPPPTKLLFQGTLLDQEGRAIPNAKIQLWQTDVNGVYKHPEAGGSTLSDFQYFGTDTTDADGKFDFLTYRPGSYEDRPQAHFHFSVWADEDDTEELLVTQFYFKDDPLSLSEPEMLRLDVTEVDSSLGFSYGSYVNGTIIIGGGADFTQPKGPFYPAVNFFSMDNDLTSV